MSTSINHKNTKETKDTAFWLNNPMVLFNKDTLLDLWPSSNMSFKEKLNAVSRLVVLLSLVGFVLTMSIKILIAGAVTLGVLVFLYYIKRDEAEREGFLDAFNYVDPANPRNLLNRKMMPVEIETVQTSVNPLNSENFYKLTNKNPLGNVLLPEIGDTPERKPAPPTFNNNVDKLVNVKTEQMAQDLHPTIQNLDKRLFQDLGDKFEFENSMIHFNTMPSTTIPNAQGAFAEFCYGNMESCKDTRTPNACGNDPPRVGSVLG
jgi:hypothetical protein